MASTQSPMWSTLLNFNAVCHNLNPARTRLRASQRYLHTAFKQISHSSIGSPVLAVATGDIHRVLQKQTHMNHDAASCRSLAILTKDDNPHTRNSYRPFILDDTSTQSDWISQLELSRVLKLSEANIAVTGDRLKVLVLYGSLRTRYVKSAV